MVTSPWLIILSIYISSYASQLPNMLTSSKCIVLRHWKFQNDGYSGIVQSPVFGNWPIFFFLILVYMININDINTTALKSWYAYCYARGRVESHFLPRSTEKIGRRRSGRHLFFFSCPHLVNGSLCTSHQMACVFVCAYHAQGHLASDEVTDEEVKFKKWLICDGEVNDVLELINPSTLAGAALFPFSIPSPITASSNQPVM